MYAFYIMYKWTYDLHDDGVLAIGDCLTTNTTLQQLSMITGNIGGETTNTFAASLAVNLSFNMLSINYGYSHSFNDTILSAMYDNSTVMKLIFHFLKNITVCYKMKWRK